MRFEHAFAMDRPADVLTVWDQPAFYEDLARQLKVSDSQAEVLDGAPPLRTSLRLTFPTTGIPGPFRRLVGERITVTWRSDWTEDGTTVGGTMDVREDSDRLTLRAGSSLTPAGERAVTWRVDGEVKIALPWPLRGAAENGLSGLFTHVLEQQATVTERWLARD